MTATPPPKIQASLFPELDQALDEAIAVYDTVDQTLARKKEVIIQGDAEALIHLDQELTALAHRLLEIEKKRHGILETHNLQDQTIGAIIQPLQGPLRQALDAKRNHLKSLLQSIEKLSQENNRLLQASIQWINGTIDVIAKALMPEGAAYDRSGGAKKSSWTAQGTQNTPYSSHTPSTLERRI